MHSLNLCVLACSLVFSFGDAKAQELKEFRPKGEGFIVLMPETPEVSEETTDGVTRKSFMVITPGLTYLISTVSLPIPKGEGEEAVKKRLDNGRDEGLRTAKAKLLKERKILLAGKYPGRAIEASLPGQERLLIARIYLVDTKLYVLVVAGKEKNVRSTNSARFLNSLTLTD
jgi:hypothetical protein